MIKKLMKSIREYKKDSLLSPAMVTLEVIMEVIIPMLMARLIDYGIQAQNLGYIWKMGILLAVTAMICRYHGRKIWSKGICRICKEPEKGYVLQCTKFFFLQY